MLWAKWLHCDEITFKIRAVLVDGLVHNIEGFVSGWFRRAGRWVHYGHLCIVIRYVLVISGGSPILSDLPFALQKEKQTKPVWWYKCVRHLCIFKLCQAFLGLVYLHLSASLVNSESTSVLPTNIFVLSLVPKVFSFSVAIFGDLLALHLLLVFFYFIVFVDDYTHA